MILSTRTSYPQAHTYVVKLHRDAIPHEGRIFGRIEHLASGIQLYFNSGEELIARLIEATEHADPSQENDHDHSGF